MRDETPEPVELGTGKLQNDCPAALPTFRGQRQHINLLLAWTIPLTFLTTWNGLSFGFGTWRAAADAVDAADGRPLWKFHNGSFNNWLRGRLVFVTRNDAAPPAVWPKRFLEASENRSLSLCHKGGIFRHSCTGLEREVGGGDSTWLLTYVAPTKQRVAARAA